MQTEKTAFISYRRTNLYMARAVYQNLTAHGYDCFLDFESIDSGSFERVILNQIAAKAHFIVVLTPSALERCVDPGDWLRREIEYALEMKRNIVPLMFDRFSFSDVQKYLVGNLTVLPQYNALEIPPAYFDEAMDRLRGRFLNKPLDVVLHPTPKADESAVQQAKGNEAARPTVLPEQLTAEEWYERANKKFDQGDWQGAIADCDEAIRLNPKHANAYITRGGAKNYLGNYDGGFEDTDKAIQLGSKDTMAYTNRGSARKNKGDYDGAIADYNEAIRINPNNAVAYNNRGNARKNKGDYDGAIADFTRSIELKNPELHLPYYNRGNARYNKGDYNGAIADYNEAIRLKPKYAQAYSNRGEALFVQKNYQKALSDFSKANELRPGYNFALAGLAITHHAMGKVDEAKRLWRLLVAMDKQYQDIEWVRKELNWARPLVEEAQKLIGKL